LKSPLQRIDIQEIGCTFQAELPDSLPSLVPRSGKGGRNAYPHQNRASRHGNCHTSAFNSCMGGEGRGGLLGFPTSGLAQAPSLSLDIQPTGNSYNDATNTMTVGAVDNCLASSTGNNNAHTHVAQLIVQNLDDLVGWQARLNYNGGQMRPQTVNFAPFADNTTGQNVSFVNLPLDGGVHRDLVTASSIPPASNGPQTALIGATYTEPRRRQFRQIPRRSRRRTTVPTPRLRVVCWQRST
jgi:hypothetical protein